MKRLWILLALFYTASVSADLPEPARWQFEVLLDEKKIGYHDFTVSQRDGNQVVKTEAKFNVKLLFVNVFSYHHQNEETWRDNCLSSIDAETASNGKDFVVRGQASTAEFQIQTESTANELPPCIMTFAYWNPEFLTAEKLLNSQSGDYEKVTIAKEGEEGLLVKGQNIQAIKYSVSGAAAPITLWYAAADHRWLALESVVKGGRILRYKPVNLPDTFTTSNAAGE